MITADGWVDWAVRIPGVPDKVYSAPNRMLGLIGHSVVGQESDFEDGVPNRFLSLDREADGRYTRNAAASCVFVLRKSGVLIQMYPVTAATWTSGGPEANTSYVPIELEGGLIGNTDEPMTDQQLASMLRLVADFEAFRGIEIVPGVTFREHGELAAELGYDATACPSNRYARLYEALEGDMADPVTQELALRLANILLIRDVGKRFASVDEALDEARRQDANEQRHTIGLGRTQESLAELRSVVEAMSPVGPGMTTDQIADALEAAGVGLAAAAAALNLADGEPDA